MSKNLYEILGITKNATIEQIRKAYKDLALKYHPDKIGDNVNADTLMKEINVAKDILCDEQKRKIYDATGKIGDSNDFSAHQFNFMFGDEQLQHFLYSRFTSRTHNIPENLLVLSPKEITLGCQRELFVKKTFYVDSHGNLTTLIPCECSNGILFFMQCAKCNGTRQIHPPNSRKVVSQGQIIVTVPSQSWGGRIIHAVSADIPAIEFEILLKIKLESNQIFDERNSQLIVTIQKNIFSLLCQDEIKINPCGTPLILIPHKIQNYYIFNEQGIYTQKQKRCNLILKIDITYPSLNNEQKEICKKLSVLF